MSLGLALCYVAVAALLLNLNVASGWSWKVKAGAIVLVSGLYGFTWLGIQSLEGWPAEEPMPQRFQLQWVAIDEPDPSDRAAGGIYFWIRHFQANGRTTEPRAYVLPYDDENADSAREALTLLQEGKRIEGRMTMQALEPDATRTADEVEEVDDGRVPGSGPPDRPRFEFREMPPPDLPPKAPL